MFKTWSDHTLPTRDIVIQSSTGGNDGDSTIFERNAGRAFPLLLINDMVVAQIEIKSCTLSICDSFLPKLYVTISDEENIYRDDIYRHKDNYITIRIGNTQDTAYRPIKNDYLILSMSPSTKTVSFECLLYVPKMYMYEQRAYDKTSWEVMKEMATQCGLGFVSNISTSQDRMKWIRRNDWHVFIDENTQYFFNGYDDAVKVFVDQYACINYVSMATALKDQTIYKIETNPFTGERITPVNLSLSNQDFISDEKHLCRIIQYNPVSNYGEGYEDIYETVNFRYRDGFAKDKETVSKTVVSDRTIKGGINDYFTVVDTDNAFPEYQTVKDSTDRIMRTYLQPTKLDLSLDTFIHILHPHMVVPIEIFSKLKRSIKQSQEKMPIDKVDEQEPTSPSYQYTKNERFSGNALISSLSYTYSSTNAERGVRQIINVMMVGGA